MNEAETPQQAWRPKIVLEYIQWNDIEPHIILAVSGYLDKKIAAVSTYSSQLYDPRSKENRTPISSKNFLDSVSYRARNFGRLIGTEAGEGFTSRQPLSIDNLDVLIR